MYLYLCCLVFKQADDYNDADDGGNDDSDGSGLRRSSCRGVERGTDNRLVYSRKGTLWRFKVTAAEWQLTCMCVCVYAAGMPQVYLTQSAITASGSCLI